MGHTPRSISRTVASCSRTLGRFHERLCCGLMSRRETSLPTVQIVCHPMIPNSQETRIIPRSSMLLHRTDTLCETDRLGL
ncbi:hypothetical protein JMJ77_0000849 [Colletotrichum scovillei]|uniref:Uncharacterized protein n=1 Tax=Colletotrichum scovillei TaxID=1209932 RepID=A0A9P7UEK5_9PEZI|nr:hypothetical protein JMJ77_0000849 [Colletotrichum scovillei]KAG7072062.1 hypothetical protein JMJ76_0004923 [Colletotrichum scovillei]KAG7080370.1 hypothetical protein JMJ78_0007465 [Colletotrichum scovillei]